MAGGALAKNTASVLLFRFLGGTFAAAPLTNSGFVIYWCPPWSSSSSWFRALISDIWDAKMRGKAMAIFTVAPFAGPALGPTVAGFISDHISWRWLFWVLTGFVSTVNPAKIHIIRWRTLLFIGRNMWTLDHIHNSRDVHVRNFLIADGSLLDNSDTLTGQNFW